MDSPSAPDAALDLRPDAGATPHPSLTPQAALYRLRSWVSFTGAYVLFDSDKHIYNQRTVQAAIRGRSNFLGVVLNDTHIFGSYHAQPFHTTNPDLNWSQDRNFFVYLMAVEGLLAPRKFTKRVGAFCQLRSLRFVPDGDSFYRVNNAFFLLPPLGKPVCKFWDDFRKDYTPTPTPFCFSDPPFFSVHRLVIYQLL